jgi:hypothetical protein
MRFLMDVAGYRGIGDIITKKIREYLNIINILTKPANYQVKWFHNFERTERSRTNRLDGAESFLRS